MNDEVSAFDITDILEIEDNAIKNASSSLAPSRFASFCSNCGGSGKGIKGEIPCSVCKRYPEYYKIEEEDLFPSSIFIPEKYKELWTYEKAMSRKLSVIDLEMVDQVGYGIWVDELNRLLKKVNNPEEIFTGSYLISAPPHFGKIRWLYTLIHKLYMQNILTSQILQGDTTTMSDEAISSPNVLLLTITRNDFKRTMDKLDTILSHRHIKAFTTVVVTDIKNRYFISDVDQQPIAFDNIIAL